MVERDSFIHSFRRAQMNFTQLYGMLLLETNLSIQQFTLLNLLNEMGAIPMTEASRRLHISKPAVTNVVDGLEQEGLLKRSPHPEDRRSYLLEILPKGEKLVDKIQVEVFDLLFKSLDFLKDHDQSAVHSFYDHLCQVMGKHISKKIETV